MAGSYGGFDGGSDGVDGFDGGSDGSDGGFDGFVGLDGGDAGWLKRMTTESRSDGERADGWAHKIREGRVDGLTTRIVHERADGLTRKIREELTVGWTLFVDVVQVVTWARKKRRASLVDSVALMAWIASTLALTVTLMMATMEASMASSRSKEETTEKSDREGLKGKCQKERRCHGSTVVLMETSMASMASMASMVASRALVVAVTVPLEWLTLMVAEPKRNDERAGGLTPRCEGILTVALEIDGFGDDCVYGSDDSTDDFDGTDSNVGFDGGFDGCAGGLAGVDGFDGGVVSVAETDDRKIREERADGLTQRLVDDDGSESGGCRWTNTSTTSCLRRTQRKSESSSALDSSHSLH